ncbi:MAG: hypothetical protein HZC06_09105 [Methylocystis sp.]|nr:hypothetical protein [Methylocystis sp.]
MANNNSGTVSIIDTGSNSVVETISSGKGPRHTYFSPNGKGACDERNLRLSGDFRCRYGRVGWRRQSRFDAAFRHCFGRQGFRFELLLRRPTVFSRSKQKALAKIAVGGGPLGAGARQRDGKRVVIVCHNANHVAVIDREKLKRVAKSRPPPVRAGDRRAEPVVRLCRQ